MTTRSSCAASRCPHCGHVHRDRAHPDWAATCPDRKAWTRAEKDAWRDQVRLVDPSVRFVGVYDMDRRS